MGRIGRPTASRSIVAQARSRISKPSTIRPRRNTIKPPRRTTREIRQKSFVSRFISKPSQPKIRRISTKRIQRVARKQPVRTSPPQRITQIPKTQVTQFGSGSSAIRNVFGLIEQTSIRNASKREEFKREGRTGSIFFDSFFDEEFL